MGTAHPAVSTCRRVCVVGAIMLAAFTFNTTENLPIGLVNLIASDLHASVPAVGYLVSGYGVTVAVASLPLAHLVRHRPRRHVLCAALAILFAGSLLSALITSYDVLFAAQCSRVLLPDPVAPITATNIPTAMPTDTPSSAVTKVRRSPYRRVTLSTSTT